MTKKLYDVLLDSNKIGTTELEKADAPMGVVFGKINFIDINSGYDFFKYFCLANKIKIPTDYPEDKLMVTAGVPNFRVVDQDGGEIKGQGINVEGMDADTFDVIIVGVPYPFFQEEFQHHVELHNAQPKDN